MAVLLVLCHPAVIANGEMTSLTILTQNYFIELLSFFLPPSPLHTPLPTPSSFALSFVVAVSGRARCSELSPRFPAGVVGISFIFYISYAFATLRLCTCYLCELLPVKEEWAQVTSPAGLASDTSHQEPLTLLSEGRLPGGWVMRTGCSGLALGAASIPVMTATFPGCRCSAAGREVGRGDAAVCHLCAQFLPAGGCCSSDGGWSGPTSGSH